MDRRDVLSCGTEVGGERGCGEKGSPRQNGRVRGEGARLTAPKRLMQIVEESDRSMVDSVPSSEFS